MKSAYLALAAAAWLLQACPAWAQSDSAANYSKWEQRLRDRVNNELAYPLGAGNASGDVLVGFTIGADGKPANVGVRQSSGNPTFDRAALRLVSHLGRLGDVPGVHGIVLKLSYGDGAATVAEAMQVARADRQEQLANERRDRDLVSGATRVAQNH